MKFRIELKKIVNLGFIVLWLDQTEFTKIINLIANVYYTYIHIYTVLMYAAQNLNNGDASGAADIYNDIRVIYILTTRLKISSTVCRVTGSKTCRTIVIINIYLYIKKRTHSFRVDS